MQFKLLILVKMVFGNICENPGKIFNFSSKILKFENSIFSKFLQEDLVMHVKVLKRMKGMKVPGDYHTK